MRILGETKLAIDNIYDRVGVRNPSAAVSLTEKLSAIMERVLDLSRKNILIPSVFTLLFLFLSDYRSEHVLVALPESTKS